MGFNYIVYHRGCLDGFVGMYLFTKSDQMVPKPYIYPDVPSATRIPPEIRGKRVIIIDVAYNPKLVEQIAEQAEQVLFIDHHKTHQQEIKQLQLKPPHKIVYRIDRCGATLVWDLFHQGKKMPRFVSLVEDNDLGRWKFEDTIPFVTAAETLLPMKPDSASLKKWDRLLDENVLDSLVENGRQFLVYKKKLIDWESKRVTTALFPSKKLRKKYRMDKKTYKIAVINGGSPSVSLVGKQVVDTHPVDFCLIYRINLRRQVYQISLRSKTGTNNDVGEVAKQLGGGGHKHASGLSIPLSFGPINNLFQKILC